MNELFREHVTSVGFSLTLGKTHIAALVELDHELKLNLPDPLRINYAVHVMLRPRELPPAFNHSCTGHDGLIRRGLIEHLVSPRDIGPGVYLGHLPPRRVWRITPAGRLAINILKEAGIYQEWAQYLPPLPTTQSELGVLRAQLRGFSQDELKQYGQQWREAA